MGIPESFQIKFLNSVEMQLQQQHNPLDQAVVMTDITGAEKIKVKDIFAAQSGNEATERHGRTVWEDPNPDNVWLVKSNEIYKAIVIDDADQLATEISLTGASSMITAGVLNRARIQRQLEGFYGPVISGKDGTVSTPFPASAIVPVTTGGAAGAQRMNTKKLREAKLYLGQQFNDRAMKRWMVLDEEDNDSLLDEVPATSTDFQSAYGARVDANGNLVQMLGFNFIHLQLDNPLLDTIPALATDASGYRKNPFWVQGGLVGNYWRRLRSKVGEVPELRFETGTLGGTTLAATRTQPGMSGIILNLKG